MLRINSELMRQRRIQLGWTSEELAEKSGLDARTIRRLEQGKTRPRLHTAVAVARALTLETSTLVSDDVSWSGEWEPLSLEDALAAKQRVAESTTVEGLMAEGLAAEGLAAEGLAAAIRGTADPLWRYADEGSVAATGDTFRTELTCEGDQGLREVMYVLSLLLTRALAMEGKGPAKQEDEGVYGVVPAFKAADVAIRTTLSGGSALDVKEVVRVLSLLLARYATAFSRSPEGDRTAALSIIDAVYKQAKAGLPDNTTPGYLLRRKTIGKPPGSLLHQEEDIRIGKKGLRKPSP